jgi:hypothetical protein
MMGLLVKTKPKELVQSKNGYAIVRDDIHMAIECTEEGRKSLASSLDHRNRMLELEANILAVDGPAVEAEYNHYFTPGVYTREMFLPAGSIWTGQIHKESSINIITKGHVKVVTDEGDYEIHAPYTFISGPGVKKALHVVTDTTWVATYPWDGKTTDFKELAKQHLYSSYAEVDQALEHTEESI